MIYTVKAVHGEPREWSSSHGGTFLSYSVDFTDEQGLNELSVEWTKKPESQPPHVGEKVAGHIEPGKFAEKFKIDYEATKELTQNNTPGSSSGRTPGSGPGNGGSNPSPGTRNLDASIARQVALKVLSPWICQDENFLTHHRKTAEDIERFILAAGQEAPVDLSGARTEEPDAFAVIDREHVMQLLDAAGLTVPAAQEKIADYITGPLLVAGREKKAITGLQDLDRQGTVLAQLKTETEKWSGAPLPQGDALDGDERIPF